MGSAERPPGALRWGVERRLAFIDFRLFWEGVANRSDLTQRFGISGQQASADFARYAEVAPGNAVYDRSRKRYVASDSFRPAIIKPDAARYLAELRLIGDGVADGADSWLGSLPSFDVVPGPSRRIDPEILKHCIAATRSRSSVEILYQSMSRPEPEWRWFSPHAFAFDGFRWHTRACCHRDGTFKDFVLARMTAARSTGEAAAAPEADQDWHTRVRVIVGPHPELSEGQRRAIEADYSMTGGVAVMDVRSCFLFYVLKRFGLDVDAAGRRPQDQHIVLLNREDVMTALASRRERVEAC